MFETLKILLSYVRSHQIDMTFEQFDAMAIHSYSEDEITRAQLLWLLANEVPK